MIVVDASIAVKRFLLGHEKLVAPTLIRIEVAAAITRKVRLGEPKVEDAEATRDPCNHGGSKFAERAGRIYPNVELLRMKMDD
jgi:hypothetical protein